MNNTLKRIVVIGPESTGKTVLSGQLADHFQTLWCPEYAREYLTSNGKSYHFDDLLAIAKGQLSLEDQLADQVIQHYSASKKNATPDPLLIIDTDMYVMKVWSEFVFGKCHRFILDQIIKRKYDLYLLCNVDLPWVEDELREYPDLENRQRLYEMYKDILINQSVPWVDISGGTDQRLSTAIAAVSSLLQ